MRKYFILFLMLIITVYCSAPLVAQDNDLLMGNIELLNGKIKDLSSRINVVKSKLSSVISDLEDFNNKSVESTRKINLRIDNLLKEFEEINVDYQATLEQIKIFREENKAQENQISILSNQIVELSSQLSRLSSTIFKIENRLEKLPDLFTNPEAIPKFGLDFALVKFVTFGLDDLNVEPVYSLGALYRIDKNYSVWAEFTSPFVLTLSSVNSVNKGTISDKWNAQLYSLGGKYQFELSQIPNLNVMVAGGIYYGALSYDKFANSSVGVDRINAEGTNTIGGNIKFGLTYNQFKLKNPLELYLVFNNLISTQNIVLKTDAVNKFDMGAYLFSVSLGINFNFW